MAMAAMDPPSRTNTVRICDELAPLLRADADYVMELQEPLTDLEFNSGPIDGDYGKGTERAVKLLQESCDLEQTGNLDINTRLCAGGHI